MTHASELLEKTIEGLLHADPQPVHIACPSHDRGRFRGLVSTEAIDHLLNVGGLRPETFRLVRSGDVPRDRYIRKRRYSPIMLADAIDPELVYQEYHRGASMLLIHAEACVEAVQKLALALAMRWGCATTAHVALSPPQGARALDTHYDSFDVVVLQVEGDKRWDVFAPCHPLPLVFQRFAKYGRRPDEADPPLMSVLLREGDVLVLPRGYLHHARCAEGHSLHVALNLRFATYYDVFDHAMRSVLRELQDDLAMRRVVEDDGLEERVTRVRTALERAIDVGAVRNAMAAELRTMTHGRLGGIHDASRLRAQDEIRLIASVHWDLRMLEGAGEALHIQVNNQEHWLPRHFEPAVRTLTTTGAIEVGRLPALEQDEALLLTRLLCILGAARVVHRGGGANG